MQGAINDRLSQVRNFIGKKVLENESLLRDLDEKKPSFLPRFIDTEVDGDKLYVTVPFLGSDFKVRKSVLSTTQIFTGGLWAGAAGELFKDILSFPLDTIRCRLMTQGSFTGKPATADKARPAVATRTRSPESQRGEGAFRPPEAGDDASESMSIVKSVLQKKTVTLSPSSESSEDQEEDLPQGTFTVERKRRYPASRAGLILEAVSNVASQAADGIKGKVADTIEAAQTNTIYRGR